MPIKKSLKYFAGIVLAAAPFLAADAAWQMAKTNMNGNANPAIKNIGVYNQAKSSDYKNTPDYKKKVIILDAGHGGKDSGAVNWLVYEKAITLKQALKIRDILKAKGFNKVYLTRENDAFVRLEDRIDFEKKKDADLFVSMHCDSFENADARGFTLYHSGSQSGKVLAEIINEKLEKELEKSNRFYKNRGIKPSKYLVVKKTKSPAVLVECGFISNAEDLTTMTDEIDDIERGIANGIESYLLETETKKL